MTDRMFWMVIERVWRRVGAREHDGAVDRHELMRGQVDRSSATLGAFCVELTREVEGELSRASLLDFLAAFEAKVYSLDRAPFATEAEVRGQRFMHARVIAVSLGETVYHLAKAEPSRWVEVGAVASRAPSPYEVLREAVEALTDNPCPSPAKSLRTGSNAAWWPGAAASRAR